MNATEIRRKVADLGVWYHKIDLGHGVVTPGQDFDAIWDMIRQVRSQLDYREKAVLDLGSWDGMWAFEADRLGATPVVATDCHWDVATYNKFLFCREILKSRVLPFYNVSPYHLHERLDVYLREGWDPSDPFRRLFDIVQHLGLLYHVRDPLLTLSQARSVLKTGGYLLMETAAVVNEPASYLLFNGTPPTSSEHIGRIYNDRTTWWAPTVPCLREMLRASLFEPLSETLRILDGGRAAEVKENLPGVPHGPVETPSPGISRVCLVARAIGGDEVSAEYFAELSRTYRNPGLAVENIPRTKSPRFQGVGSGKATARSAIATPLRGLINWLHRPRPGNRAG